MTSFSITDKQLQKLKQEKTLGVKIRSQVVAPKDHYIFSADLSQAETWIVGHLANEPRMIKALKYGDIHVETAGALFFDDKYCNHTWIKQGKDKKWLCEACGSEIVDTSRYIGKQNNHANSYGMEAPRQAQVINKQSDKPPYVTVTVAQCRVNQTKWHGFYPNIQARFWADIQRQLNINRTLTTFYGRERVFYGQWGKELFKEGYAYIPQSTVADHFNGAVSPELGIEGGLRLIHKKLVTKGAIKITNQSHDSLMCEVHKDLTNEVGSVILECLSRPIVLNDLEFTIPVDAEYGERWGELEPWKMAA